MCISAFSWMCVCVHRGVGSVEAGSIDGSESLLECGKLDLGLLQEQQMLLPAKSMLQTHIMCFDQIHPYSFFNSVNILCTIIIF